MNNYFPSLIQSFTPLIINEQESINSNESKQTIYFQSVLDLVIEKLNELKLGSDAKIAIEQIQKMNIIIDSIYKDFCIHLEISSLHVILTSMT